MTSNPMVQSKSPNPGNVHRSRAGSVVALVLGTILAMLGVGGIAGGIASAVVASQQGPDGYFTSSAHGFSTASYALISPPADIGTDRIPFDLGSIRLAATSSAPGGQVFIGIGPKAQVESYLSGVHTTQITGIETSPFRVSYRDQPGTATPTAPAAQGFWTESASGPGTQQVTMDISGADVVMVVMNADASAGVSVKMQAGFHSELFGTLTPALLIAGILILLVGAGLIALGAIGVGRGLPPSSQGGAGRPSVGTATGTAVPGDVGTPGSMAEAKRYPAQLSGYLDPQLSRGLWLVKWLLAIPHFIILFFLWFAFFFTTLIAGLAILFTGRYPRSLFDFNVGVLRWNWRVAFYAYSALATDKYPPFTFAATDYPADFEVDYPQRLAHGLVLVKGWLLAIPHLLIIAIFTGSVWAPWGGSDSWGQDYARNTGFSLLGLLVLIAAVMLLFTGRYQPTLFDLVMGINRWIYRVACYALLMRDEYPPFRLDQGPAEPGAPFEPPPVDGQPGPPV
ncbi:DUF4389 domain-containing protein [Arthrobacter alpinus]|uniref:DUF4389 domain-containing protein n=1 Tax=Arthrobacter alpinus TaxID=656366 RepID=UPI0021BD06BA|nr:DUF4389 domain-containing protein [Arthrobacter alpinus]